MNKRGQFFLIAAVIIITIVVSLAAAVNSINVGDKNRALADRGKEIKYETNRVLDFGFYNEEDADSLTEEFLDEYANYLAKEEVLFLLGNENELKALHFVNANIGSVGIDTGGSSTGVQIEDIVNGQVADVSVINGEINVNIGGTVYKFNLKEGENFYFVLREKRGEELHVIQK